MLAKIDGAECPECGCTESEMIRDLDHWGTRSEERRCGHCSNVFIVQLEDEVQDEAPGNGAVIYPVLRCPRCKLKRPGVKSTRGLIRHHKCDGCGARFKSAEER